MMKFLLYPAIAGLLFSSANASTVLINFAYGQNTPVDGYNLVGSVNSTVNLKYTDGSSSNYSVRMTRTAAGGSGNTNIQPSDMIGSSWAAASGGYGLSQNVYNNGLGYASDGSNSATLTISNLVAGQSYTFFLYHGRGSSGQGNCTLTATGIAEYTPQSFLEINQDTTLNPSVSFDSGTGTLTAGGFAVGSNNSNYTEFTFIASGGDLSVNLTGANTAYAFLAAGLRENAIPEPATATLAGAALLAFGIRRKKS